MFTLKRDSRCRLQALWLLTVSAVLLTAADATWKDKPAQNWTEEDARQVLVDSPWAKTTTGIISRKETEFELRDGGKMGQGHGVGYDGVDGNKTKAQEAATFFGSGTNGTPPSSKAVKLQLRWESALPVRLAELKARVVEPPTLSEDGYSLAVYGVPGTYFKNDPESLGAPLKKAAVLKREGKKDLRPSNVEVFQREDGLVIVYTFPVSAEIGKNDGRMEFDAQIGRLAIAQDFDAREMQFQGKVEL